MTHFGTLHHQVRDGLEDLSFIHFIFHRLTDKSVSYTKIRHRRPNTTLDNAVPIRQYRFPSTVRNC